MAAVPLHATTLLHFLSLYWTMRYALVQKIENFRLTYGVGTDSVSSPKENRSLEIDAVDKYVGYQYCSQRSRLP